MTFQFKITPSLDHSEYGFIDTVHTFSSTWPFAKALGNLSQSMWSLSACIWCYTFTRYHHEPQMGRQRIWNSFWTQDEGGSSSNPQEAMDDITQQCQLATSRILSASPQSKSFCQWMCCYSVGFAWWRCSPSWYQPAATRTSSEALQWKVFNSKYSIRWPDRR